jgi:regulator of sigma E protease
MTWAVAIVALSLLIIIHEFGHYLAARATGMHVDRFSVLGIGPVVLRLGYYRGTEFVISAIPFGAYVHIVGMEPEEDGEAQAEPERPPPGVGPNGKDFPRDYANFRERPVWARLLVIAGGPIANYLTAMAICVAVFSGAGIKAPTSVAIGGFDEGSPAEAAGLLEGDVFVSVAGEDVTGLDPAKKLNAATAENLGKTVQVTVDREGERITVPVALNGKAPALNVALRGIGEWVPVAPGEAVWRGIKWPFQQTAIQLGGLYAMITGKMEGRVGGPVAIARAIKTSAERGALDLLLFSALISTVLGMFNLLPLPALDGGRLAFLFYELVARRPANQQVEGWIHAIGMIGILGLLGYATIGDIRGPQTPVWKPAAAKIRAELAKQKAEAAQPADSTAESDAAPDD